MVDDMAFEFLSVLHTDAVKRGDRARFSECVAAFRERLPDVYDKCGHYYLSWRVSTLWPRTDSRTSRP